MKILAERIWKILISLRLAVTLLITLAVSLMIATFIESFYDSKTAQYFVYQATWFYVLLSMLGLNILAVAISRYPWKPKHTPFLLAHAGILMLLTGAWFTYVKGLDGNLRISEGEVSSGIELDHHVVSLSATSQGGADQIHSFPLPWLPKSVAKNFKPIVLKDYGLVIDQYLADAESKVTFPSALPSDLASAQDAEKALGKKTGAAVQFKIIGAPMGGAPEVWLWTGDSSWAMQKLGLARFLIRTEAQKDLTQIGLPPGGAEPEARFDFVVTRSGKLRYETVSIRGEKKSGEVNLNADGPQIIDPGWRMPIKIQFKKFVPLAYHQTDFAAMPETAGTSGMLPSPAIHLSLINTGLINTSLNNAEKSNSQTSLWLGMGDRAELVKSDGTKISVGYFPKLVVLPFALHLKRFEVLHDPGTNNPAAYVSHVQVVEGLQKDEKQLAALPVHEISMNEPLPMKQYTFYQASFIPDFPRPTTTVLSVNYDPGRGLKYWGSILLVSGVILLFAMKSLGKKKEATV